VHPYGLLPRFIAFEHLLGELPVHPRVALSPEELAEASKAGFWELPVQSVLRQPTPEQAEQIARTYAPLALIDAPRQVHLMGACELADAAYQAVGKDLKQKLTQADVEETISVLAEAMENLAFFRALNACDGGNMSEGEKLLREYLKAYPTGRWAALARTDLSEVLDQKGEAAAAENLWKDLPAERKLFGSLRLRGMLGSARPPAPPAPSPAAAGEAEPGALAR
jgi:hypothetical protein